MNDVPCRDVRVLLGVYIVGAISAEDRRTVDDHLPGCAGCREELAELAGIPAMLGRIAPAEAERISLADATQQPGSPAGEQVDSLVRKVAAARTGRRRRAMLALAASAAVLAGGAAATVALLPRPAQAEQVTASNRVDGVTALVVYSPVSWGTAMRIRVGGIPVGTTCRFWVISDTGARTLAGTWTITAGYSRKWYPAASRVSEAGVREFQISAQGRVLIQIATH